LIETTSATRATRPDHRPIQHRFFNPSQKKSRLEERRKGAQIKGLMPRKELSRLPGMRRTITSMAMREIKSDVSFANAVGHTQKR
jgi:hypothetical protein